MYVGSAVHKQESDMTLQEANDAVEVALDAREDAIFHLLDSQAGEVLEAIELLEAAHNAYYEALEVWARLDDAAQK